MRDEPDVSHQHATGIDPIAECGNSISAFWSIRCRSCRSYGSGLSCEPRWLRAASQPSWHWTVHSPLAWTRFPEMHMSLMCSKQSKEKGVVSSCPGKSPSKEASKESFRCWEPRPLRILRMQSFTHLLVKLSTSVLRCRCWLSHHCLKVPCCTAVPANLEGGWDASLTLVGEMGQGSTSQAAQRAL